LIPLIILGLGAGIFFVNILTQKTESHLQTIVKDHAQVIELFLDKRMRALTLVTLSYSNREIEDAQKLKKVFDNLNLCYSNSFYDLGVIDDTGKHLAYIGPHDLLQKNYRETFWFKAALKDWAYISDVFLGYRNVPHFVVAVRKDNPDGSFWILRASINPKAFEDLVAKGRLGATGDCFIVDREGRFQTPQASGAPLLSPSDIQNPIYHDDVKTFRAQGNNKKSILRTTKWINNRQWMLVAQQEENEALAPVRTAIKRGLTIFGLGVLLIVMTSFFTTRALIRLIDKSEKKRAALNQQLLRASKLASLGELSSGLAHEINNPLAIIYSEQTNISDLIKEMNLDDPFIQEISQSVATTMKHVNRSKTITQKMLQFGRFSDTEPEEIDISKHIFEIVRLMATQAQVRNVEICVEADADTPRAVINATEFQQVITNLINNAIQAISGRGGVLVQGWFEEEMVNISVEDTGSGIPPELLDKIFEPFFTTKAVGSGTGLGLSVCYGILSKWKGSIHAESTPDSGALFHIKIPAKKGE
jgi:two-component system NtrC family sensor kinase